MYLYKLWVKNDIFYSQKTQPKLEKSGQRGIT
jgi:hypothetical protein